MNTDFDSLIPKAAKKSPYCYAVAATLIKYRINQSDLARFATEFSTDLSPRNQRSTINQWFNGNAIGLSDMIPMLYRAFAAMERTDGETGAETYFLNTFMARHAELLEIKKQFLKRDIGGESEYKKLLQFDVSPEEFFADYEGSEDDEDEDVVSDVENDRQAQEADDELEDTEEEDLEQDEEIEDEEEEDLEGDEEE